jgi:hypothetical protein
LALRRAPWWRWWLGLSVVWAARGVALGSSGIDCGDARIQIWGSAFIAVVLKTSWWHG